MNLFFFRGGILYILKIVKLVLSALGQFIIKLAPESPTSNGSEPRWAPSVTRSRFIIGRFQCTIVNCCRHLWWIMWTCIFRASVGRNEILKEALLSPPTHNCELMVKAVAEKLAVAMAEQVIYWIASAHLTLHLRTFLVFADPSIWQAWVYLGQNIKITRSRRKSF